MASRREMLLAAQKKNEAKDKTNVKNDETLVDVYANSDNNSTIINTDNAGELAKSNSDDLNISEKSAENDKKIEKNVDLTDKQDKPDITETKKNTTDKANIKSKSKKSATNNDTVNTLIELNKKKHLKQNRVGFIVTDKAIENLDRYVELTGYKSRNALLNTILENLDDFLK